MNQTFGSTGPASIVVVAKTAKVFTFSADFGGNVFGCSDPPPDVGTITAGKGPNHWSPAGFSVQRTTQAFGTVTLAYSFKTQTITGGGVNVPCNPGLSWKVSDKFAGKTFTGTIEITLPDSSHATSVVNLTRS